jgi:hypothetical protein
MFSDPRLIRRYCDSLSFASLFAASTHCRIEGAAVEQQVLTDDEPGGRGAQMGSIPIVVHHLQFRSPTSVKEEVGMYRYYHYSKAD